MSGGGEGKSKEKRTVTSAGPEAGSEGGGRMGAGVVECGGGGG